MPVLTPLTAGLSLDPFEGIAEVVRLLLGHALARLADSHDANDGSDSDRDSQDREQAPHLVSQERPDGRAQERDVVQRSPLWTVSSRTEPLSPGVSISRGRCRPRLIEAKCCEPSWSNFAPGDCTRQSRTVASSTTHVAGEVGGVALTPHGHLAASGAPARLQPSVSSQMSDFGALCGTYEVHYCTAISSREKTPCLRVDSSSSMHH